jgi:hypothetical protein
MRLILINMLCLSVSAYGFEVSEKLINSFTREVYYRYYLIKRCEDPVTILINNKKIWSKINFELISIDLIESAEIKSTALTLQQFHQPEPFMQLWLQMKAYRNINDSSFEKDFVKLLFMLYKSLNINPHHKTSIEVYAPEPSSSSSIKVMLSIIDTNIETLTLKGPTHPKEQRFFDDKEVTTDDIALNYYLMQRLNKSIKLLSTIEKFELSSLLSSLKKSTIDTMTFDTEIHFSHDRINLFFSHLLIEKNLAPLFHMWQECAHFRHAGDSHFFKEMLMMLFTVYKELLLTKLNQESEQVIASEMSAILDLYEHINELPLDEILNAIDLTTDKLELLQNMEKKGKKEWTLQQYPIVFHTLLALPIAYLLIKLSTL